MSHGNPGDRPNVRPSSHFGVGLPPQRSARSERVIPAGHRSVDERPGSASHPGRLGPGLPVDLNEVAIPVFHTQLDKVVTTHPKRVDVHMEHLQAMSDAAARTLSMANAELPFETDIYQWGANERVQETLRRIGLGDSFKKEQAKTP